MKGCSGEHLNWHQNLSGDLGDCSQPGITLIQGVAPVLLHLTRLDTAIPEKLAADWRVFLSWHASLLETTPGSLEIEIMLAYLLVYFERRLAWKRGQRGVKEAWEGAQGKWARVDRRYANPETTSSGKFCEKPFKRCFKTEVRGKCSHLSPVCKQSPNCQVL